MQADYAAKLACLLPGGRAQIPWSLIRANIKTFPGALFVPLKRGPRGVPTGTATRFQRMGCFPGCVQFGNKLGRAGFHTQRIHPARPAPPRPPFVCEVQSRDVCVSWATTAATVARCSLNRRHQSAFGEGDVGLRLMLEDHFPIPFH